MSTVAKNSKTPAPKAPAKEAKDQTKTQTKEQSKDQTKTQKTQPEKKKVEKTDTDQPVEKKKGSVKVTGTTAKKLKENTETAADSGEKTKKAVKTKKEKGAPPNARTELIGCALNVNFAKSDMLLFIQKTLGMPFGSIKADCAYVAILETIALYLVKASGKYNAKNAEKANLYEVTVENLQRAVRESNDFGSELKEVSENYKSGTINYASTFLGGKKSGLAPDEVLRELLQSKAFINTTNVTVNNEALNYVCYMLSHTIGHLTKTACVLSQFAGLKNVQIKNYRCAVEIHFSGELKQVLFQRIDEVADKVANSKEEGEAGEAAEEEEQTNNKKKTTKKTVKDEAEEEEANDEEVEEADPEEAEEGEGDEEEAAEEE